MPDSNESASATPPLRTFQFDAGQIGNISNSVNLFRGDVGLPLTLVSLSHDNGLDVTVAGTYSSNVQRQVNTWNYEAPTGVLGLGWAIPLSYVMRQPRTSTNPLDAVFVLNLAGTMYTLSRQGVDTKTGLASYITDNYQTWLILYDPRDERWEVTTENGVTYVFGGGLNSGNGGNKSSQGNSVQWGVTWDNWSGPSQITQGQQQYARVWNLALVLNPWNEKVQFFYGNGEASVPPFLPLEEQVGNGGLTYTKASYLQQIIDAYGRTITFMYEPKVYQPGVLCEYVDPYKKVPDNLPNAYQSTYETRYLAQINVHSEHQTLLYSVVFDYTLLNNTSVSVTPDQRVYLWKRYLTSIRQMSSAGATMPGLSFSYFGNTDPHPGSIKGVTYANGGSANYVYSRLSIVSNRNKVLSSPGTGYVPRVWHGAQDSIIIWYSVAHRDLQIWSYFWSGQWVAQKVLGVTLPDLALSTLDVLIGNDQFSVHFQDKGPSEWFYLFRRSAYQLGNWGAPLVQRWPLSGNPLPSVRTAGSNFVLVYNSGFTNPGVRGYYWNWRSQSWQTPRLPTLQGDLVTLIANSSWYIACAYSAAQTLITFQLFYEDEMDNWASGSSWSRSAQIAKNPGSSNYALDLALGDSWVVATYLNPYTGQPTQLTYTSLVFQWNSLFSVISPADPLVKTLTSSLVNGELQLPVSQARVQGSVVAYANTAVRYAGGNPAGTPPATRWKTGSITTSGSKTASYQFTEDTDLVVMSSSENTTSTTQLMRYDPSVSNWQLPQQAPANASSAQAGASYLLIGTKLYFWSTQQQSWSLIPLTINGTINAATVQSRSPNYIAYEQGNASNTTTSLILMSNGAATVINISPSTPQRFSVDQAGLPGTNLCGARAFVTYASAEKFDAASQLQIHYVVDGAATGPVTALPVTSLQITNGIDKQSVQTYFTYNPTYATYNSASSIAQFAQATSSAGGDGTGQSPSGRSEFFYSNGLPQNTSFYPQGTIYNYVGVLNGTLLCTRHYPTNSQTAVATEVNYWVLDQLNPNGSGQYLSGARFRMAKKISTLDGGIPETTTYTYDAFSGLPTRTDQTFIDELGVAKIRSDVVTYAYTVPAYSEAMKAKHLFTPLVQRQRIFSDQQNNLGNPVIVSSDVTTWKNWATNASDWKWAPYQGFSWLGTGPANYFQGTPLTADWQLINGTISRLLPAVLPQETFDQSGLSQSYLYDNIGKNMIAHFQGASVVIGDGSSPSTTSEAGYYGFEQYEVNSFWILGSRTQIVTGDADTGERSLLVSPNQPGELALSASFMPRLERATSPFLLSFAVKLPRGFAQDGGAAAWQITVLQNGSPLGAPIVVPIAGVEGKWTGVQQRIDLGAYPLTPNIPTTLKIQAYNHKATAAFFIDNIRVSPYACAFMGSVFNRSSQLIAALGSNNEKFFYVFDTSLDQVATIKPDGVIENVTVNYYSRTGNADVFSATEPNSTLIVKARSGGIYDGFQNGIQWLADWTPGVPGDWQTGDGTLQHKQAILDTLTLTAPDFQADYGVFFKLAMTAPVLAPLGIRVGTDLTIEWSPGTGAWSLTNNTTSRERKLPLFSLDSATYEHELNTGNISSALRAAFLKAGAPLGVDATSTVNSGDGSWNILGGSQRGIFYIRKELSLLKVYCLPQTWVLLLAGRTFQFYADGRQIFSVIADTLCTGLFQFYTSSVLSLADIAAFRDVQCALAFHDATGNTRQSQIQIDEECLVSQTVPDILGRPAIRTKSCRIAPLPEVPLLSYRSDIVTRIDYATGELTGLVADYYPADEGYPYVSSLYEKSPLQRVVEQGAPGKLLAIVPGSNDPHTIRQAYGVNAGEGTIPPGAFLQNTSVDQQNVPASNVASTVRGEIQRVFGQTSDKAALKSTTHYDMYGNVTSFAPPNYFAPPVGSIGSDYLLRQDFTFLGLVAERTSKDVGENRYIYDASQQLRFMQDAVGAANNWFSYNKYDPFGRVLEKGYMVGTWEQANLQRYADQDPTWPPTPQTWRRKYIYDGDGTQAFAIGQLVRVLTNNGSSGQADVEETVSYDILGQIIRHTLLVANYNQKVSVTAYEYDSVGNVTRISFPGETGKNGTAIADIVHTFNMLNQMQTLTSSDGSLDVSFTYNPDGSIQSETIQLSSGKELKRTISYNSPGWPSSISDVIDDAPPLFQENLQYFSDGYNGAVYYDGKVTRADYDFSWPGAPSAYSYQYQYDDIGELTVAACSLGDDWSLGIATPLNYDANGNLQYYSQGLDTITYAYEEGTNRVSTVSSTAVADPVASYNYDLSGAVHVEQMLDQDRRLVFAYDPLSRLATSVQCLSADGPVEVELTYNASSQRVLKRSQYTGGNTQTKLYHFGTDVASPVLERSKNAQGDETVTQYIYGPSGLIAILSYENESPTPFYVQKDHIGSTRVIVDGEGAVQASFDYLPYGNLGRATGPLQDQFSYLYTGQEFDTETALYNYRARFYDPQLGRFYAPDPEAELFSPYVYAEGDPIIYSDPTGGMGFLAILAIIGQVLVDVVIEVASEGTATPLIAAEVVAESTATAAAEEGLTVVAEASAETALTTARLTRVATTGAKEAETVASEGGETVVGSGTSVARSTSELSKVPHSPVVDTPPPGARYVGQHWTSSEFDESFARGLSAEKAGDNFGGGSQLGEGFYTTRNEKALELFGDRAVRNYGGTVRKWNVYVKDFETMERSTVPSNLHWQKMLWKDNPLVKKYMKYDYLSSRISSLGGLQRKFNPRSFQKVFIVRRNYSTWVKNSYSGSRALSTRGASSVGTNFVKVLRFMK